MQNVLFDHRVDQYEVVGDAIIRSVRRRDGRTASSSVRLDIPESARPWPADALHDLAWMRSTVPPANRSDEFVQVVDLFAGCGGLTLGVSEACRALGLRMSPVLAMDIDEEALGTYSDNFPGAALLSTPIEQVLSPFGTVGTSAPERRLVDMVGEVDILIGGPPCQGHSDLNNHTRRADPKNQLYSLMARFCELVKPAHVVIENVPGVERDRSRVAQRTWEYLQSLGYEVDSAVITASEVGAAQTRRRSITLASLKMTPSVMHAAADVATPLRPLRWAISDIGVRPENAPFDTAPDASLENRRRIEYLFDHGLYELPDEERPDCHRLKSHSYVSMYGRLRWDLPAPTITTGFGSMGRGRWVHPDEPRTITPHEAARIQGFPDFFRFEDANRSLLHKVIGNAVPPKLGYAVGLHLLR